MHAALDFSFQFPDITAEWHANSNTLACLAAKDENDLKTLMHKLRANEINFTVFREPDLNNQITALCIEPSEGARKLLSNHPLMLRVPQRDTIDFHYNKASNSDPSIPPWVVKSKGKTHYVHHVDVENGSEWSTRETPGHESTKGSIRFRGRMEIVQEGDKTLAKIK